MENFKIHYIENDFVHNDKVEAYNSRIHQEVNNPIEVSDFIVCGGGDGTLLKNIKDYGHLGIPFWGFNAGTVGFLMNDNLPLDWFELSESKYTIKKFTMINVTVTYTKKVPDRATASIYEKDIEETRTFQAFNDVSIGGDMNSWIEFNLNEKDDFFGTFMGGGLIISTPQGSTGINKNNGGSVLPMSSKLWSITGDKTNRPINYVINRRKIGIEVSSRTPVTVWVDGSNDIIKNASKIVIKKGDVVKVAFGDYINFKKKRRI